MPFSKEIKLNDTSLVYLHQTKTRSQIIYSITLLSVLTAILSLPFIYTSVSVKGTGSLQSNIEKTELLSPISGRIMELNLRDNDKIAKGELLMTIDASLQFQQNISIAHKLEQFKLQLQDAITVLKFSDNVILDKQPKLNTGLYNTSWQQYLEQTKYNINASQQAFKIYNRYETLHRTNVVTQSEYEEFKFKYEQASSELNMVRKKFKNQWETEINEYQNELRDLETQKIQMMEQEKLYTLRAPISGSIQNLTGFQKGTYVSTNQKLGEISPDSALLAICLIKPSNIGLIKNGQVVNFQIDAFSYNQWGILTGRVFDISEDIIIVNQIPFFKVKCKLDKHYLQLKNGYKGHVKKGMTFNARFIIANRSLFQLLYDKIDDWLNPNTIGLEKA